MKQSQVLQVRKIVPMSLTHGVERSSKSPRGLRIAEELRDGHTCQESFVARESPESTGDTFRTSMLGHRSESSAIALAHRLQMCFGRLPQFEHLSFE